MKRRTAKQVPADGVVVQNAAALESQILDKLVALRAHCAVNRYEDGEPRRTGWFTVKTLGNVWVVQLKEPDTALSLSVTGQNLDDALVLADLMLQSEDAPWEPDAFLKTSQTTKKRA